MSRATVVVGSGLAAGLIMWFASALGTANLHPSEKAPVQIVLVTWAVLCGLASGVLIDRRRGRSDEVLFGATAGAVGGALCGAVYALVIGVSYVATFGGSPVDFSDTLVLILSYPVFAALGALIGTLPGSLLGLCAGIVLRRATAPRVTR